MKEYFLSVTNKRQGIIYALIDTIAENNVRLDPEDILCFSQHAKAKRKVNLLTSLSFSDGGVIRNIDRQDAEPVLEYLIKKRLVEVHDFGHRGKVLLLTDHGKNFRKDFLSRDFAKLSGVNPRL